MRSALPTAAPHSAAPHSRFARERESESYAASAREPFSAGVIAPEPLISVISEAE